MYNICRIYKRTQIIKNLLYTAFHKVYKVYPDSITHKTEQFFKGVWGLSLPFHLLAVFDLSWCCSFDLWNAGVPVCHLLWHKNILNVCKLLLISIRHKSSWPFKSEQNSQMSRTKCCNQVLNIGHWLDGLFGCDSTTTPYTSRHYKYYRCERSSGTQKLWTALSEVKGPKNILIACRRVLTS